MVRSPNSGYEMFIRFYNLLDEMRTTRIYSHSRRRLATVHLRVLLLALLHLNLWQQQLLVVQGAGSSSILLLSDSLRTSDSLLSPSGVFKFGFYRAPRGDRFGLAIWYAQLPSSVRTVVWMAARNHPQLSASAYLKLSLPDGVLQLMDPEVSTQQPVWQSENKGPATILELRDTGNLLLFHNATAATPVWQTFDTPTDTLLPDQMFTTITSTSLVSWQHASNWSEGFYRAGWLPLPLNTTTTLTFTLSWTGTSILNWNRTSWSTTNVTITNDNTNTNTTLYPYQQANSNATYAVLDSASGNFYIGNTPVITNTSVESLQRVTLDEDGGLRMYSWAGGGGESWTEVGNWMNDSCRIFAECGPFGVCSSNPFSPATRASCTCPERFVPVDEKNLLKGCKPELAVPESGGMCGLNGSLFEVVKVGEFDYPYANRVYPGVQIEEAECVRRCVEDCRCAGAVYWTRGGTCFIKSTPLFNGGYPQEVGNRTAYLKVLKASLSPRRRSRVGLFAGLASASVILLLGSVLGVLYWRRRRRKTRRWQGRRASLFRHTLNLGPRKFTYRELRAATKHFSDSERVGSGGMGSVYKGILRRTGTLIAVKRIRHESTEDGEEGFLAEASSLSQIRHRNLMQLQGWCHEDGKLLLVYDYMPNGSLDQWLHGKPTKGTKANKPGNKPNCHSLGLSWELRFSIVKGVAAALAYLHDEWQQCVLHRDIKSSNVMLDADFNAHLGDFGLARLIDHQKVEKTTLMAGTLGYMAPEIPYTGKATKESDVYSFGVLLLEVVSGRHPVQSSGEVEPDDVVLLHRVWRAHESGNLLSVVDPKLQVASRHNVLTRGSAGQNAVLSQKVVSQEVDDGYALALSRRVEQEILTENEQKVMVLKLGLLCCLPKPLSRPTMRVVNQAFISGEMTSLPPLPATAYLGAEDMLEAVRAGIHPQPAVSEELVSPLHSTAHSNSST